MPPPAPHRAGAPMHPHRVLPDAHLDIALILLVLLVTVGARLMWVTLEAAWYDEVISVRFLNSPSLGLFLANVRRYSPAVPPLYFIIEYYYAQLVGSGVFALRGLSIAFGGGTAVGVYLIGRMQGSRLAATIAGIGYGLSSVNIYFDQEIRMYALVVVLATISMAALWAVTYGGSRYWWFIHGAANCGILWSQPISGCLLLGQGVYLWLAQRNPLRVLIAWSTAHLLFGLVFMAWFRSVQLGKAMSGLEWINPASIRDLVYCTLWPSTLVGRLQFTWFPVAAALIAVALAAACLHALFLQTGPASPRLRLSLPKDRTLFLLTWLLSPACALYLFSILVRPAMVDRYALVSTPALLLLLGFGAAGLSRRAARLGALSALLATAFLGHALVDRPERVDWPAALPPLQQAMMEDEQAILYVWPPREAEVLDYYLPVIDRSRIRAVARETERAVEQLACPPPDKPADRLLLILLRLGAGREWTLKTALTAHAIPYEVLANKPHHFMLLRLPCDSAASIPKNDGAPLDLAG